MLRTTMKGMVTKFHLELADSAFIIALIQNKQLEKTLTLFPGSLENGEIVKF